MDWSYRHKQIRRINNDGPKKNIFKPMDRLVLLLEKIYKNQSTDLTEEKKRCWYRCMYVIKRSQRSRRVFSDLKPLKRVKHLPLHSSLTIFPEPAFANLLRSPGFDSLRGGPVRHPYLSYRPARLHRLAKSIPRLLKRLQIRAQVIPGHIFNDDIKSSNSSGQSK